MLLDSYSLKTGIASLLPAPAPAGFVKRVNASFSKIEPLLKTLQVRPSPPEALVQAYLVHIADKNNANFRKILDLKGIRSRQEQNHLVELFQIHRDSDRYKGGGGSGNNSTLQNSNPILAGLQSSNNIINNPAATASSTVSQGLGLGTLNLTTTAAAAAAASANLPGRFDPSLLGSAIISAAKDGVDRFGNPSLAATLGGSGSGIGSGTTSNNNAGMGSGITGTGRISPRPTSPKPPSAQLNQQEAPSTSTSSTSQVPETTTTTSTSTAANLNENLKNLGKFFRRDLGGFGGRFGRGGDDAGGGGMGGSSS